MHLDNRITRQFSALFAVFSVLALVSCGGEEDSSSPTEEGEGEEGEAEAEEGEGEEAEAEGGREGEAEGEGELCARWSTECASSSAYQLCVPGESSSETEWAVFPTSCGEGRSCSDGACAGACQNPEVLLLVDVSSSMLDGGKWEYMTSALRQFVEAFAEVVKFGIRTFPADGCDISPAIAPAYDNSAAVLGELVEPSASSLTPIAAALAGLAPLFGDPNEGQFVLLLTDGGETCDKGTTDAVVAQITELRAHSIETFGIGIGTTANMTLLSAVAAEGGTNSAFGTGDETDLVGVLEEIIVHAIDCDDACFGRECGTCGGPCTEYANSYCTRFGSCFCEPSCVGRECGSDGCTGTCGVCPSAGDCQDGVCPRFVTNGDGTISDWETGLMWQQSDVSNGEALWAGAHSTCNSLTFAGYANWRLPTGRCTSGEICDWEDAVGELTAIVDESVPGCSTGDEPCIVPGFEIGRYSNWNPYNYSPHFSADSHPTSTGWEINFNGPSKRRGSAFFTTVGAETNTNRFFCVREFL